MQSVKNNKFGPLIEVPFGMACFLYVFTQKYCSLFSLLFAWRLKELFAITTFRFVSLKAEYKKKAGNDLAQPNVFISAPVCHLGNGLLAMVNVFHECYFDVQWTYSFLHR